MLDLCIDLIIVRGITLSNVLFSAVFCDLSPWLRVLLGDGLYFLLRIAGQFALHCNDCFGAAFDSEFLLFSHMDSDASMIQPLDTEQFFSAVFSVFFSLSSGWEYWNYTPSHFIPTGN